MVTDPFYDPNKSYQENFDQGPFGDFADGRVISDEGQPEHIFLNNPVFEPFGIPAGPLLNAKFVKAALDKGFDIPTYKTVRTKAYPCHPWPNVLPVKVDGNLTPEMNRLVTKDEYTDPLSITNSFGVPSFNPDFWQEDIASAVKYAKPGQVVVGSFQGTNSGGGNVQGYIDDFVLGARLLKETGVKIIEVNLSCPNEGTAHLLCFDIQRTKQITEAIKNEIGNLPLIIKTAYFKSDEELKKLIDAVGKTIDGIASINTIAAEIVDDKGQQALPGEGRLASGVCGTSIKWAGLDQTARLAKIKQEKDLKFTIIGVGGVSTPKDYADYRALGADAVMAATGAMWNPSLAQEIKAKNL
jgi:dihydroorotate dehydrogenase